MTGYSEIPINVLSSIRYESGKLYWIDCVAARVKVGDEVGHFDSRGYRWFVFNYKKYAVHRVIWTMHFGQIPPGMQIDHINGLKSDNRISNLRLSTCGENQRNRKATEGGSSFFKGVSWCGKLNKWNARIGIGKKRYNLGYFNKEIDAAIAYDLAAREHHKEFAVLNLLYKRDDPAHG